MDEMDKMWVPHEPPHLLLHAIFADLFILDVNLLGFYFLLIIMEQQDKHP